MADVHSPEARRKNMRAIRSRDTKPEIFIRKMLYSAGFRYSVCPASIAGKPDLYFPRYKAVIFVHGCFWHAHGCYLFKLPQSRKDFWQQKLNNNIDRDRRNLQLLIEKGYRVLVIWECAIKGKLKLEPRHLQERIIEWLNDGKLSACVDCNGFSQISSFSSVAI